jgi:hypothetical protein
MHTWIADIDLQNIPHLAFWVHCIDVEPFDQFYTKLICNILD